MAGGRHTPLHLPQVRQDRWTNATASSGEGSTLAGIGGGISSSAAIARRLRFRHRRVAFFDVFMLRNIVAHATSLSANSRSDEPLTTQPPLTQAGEGNTASAVNARELFDRLNGHGLWSSCSAFALSRHPDPISQDSSNQCTTHAKASRLAHEHARPASPRVARRCAPPGSAGGAESPPLPQPSPSRSLPNWAVRSVEQADGPLFGKGR